jgi:hypothetical protein
LRNQGIVYAIRTTHGPANSEFAIAWLSQLPIKRSHNHRLEVLAKTFLHANLMIYLKCNFTGEIYGQRFGSPF